MEVLCMKYQIMGTTMPAVEIQFDRPGESVYTPVRRHDLG